MSENPGSAAVELSDFMDAHNKVIREIAAKGARTFLVSGDRVIIDVTDLSRALSDLEIDGMNKMLSQVVRR